MAFLSIFRKSFRELKDVRCLCVTGILTALYIVLEVFVSIDLGYLKINFAYLALAGIGMLYGPSVCMIAAIPCDILSAMFKGFTVIPVFTLIAMLEALIYSLFLYKQDFNNLKFRKNNFFRNDIKKYLRIIISKTVSIVVINMFLNTVAAYYTVTLAGGLPLSSKYSLLAYLGLKAGKNIIELPVDIILMLIILPAVCMAHKRTMQYFSIRRKAER